MQRDGRRGILSRPGDLEAALPVRGEGQFFCYSADMLRIFKSADEATLAEIAEEMRVRQTDKFVLLFSMGSQFDHLIVQALAKLGAYCVVADPASVTADDVKKAKPAGIILFRGSAFVHRGH